ncbi:hypothetical protein Bca52824_032740 [Brassica carinata]|uniref:Uncharacterized protein n=1 Tax=Brassica carinata TaxID=52824 RepID=A0A8X7SHG3_BRACI|nr:hypothetical protein Bca52824_032740 [Brassica carinata]
MHTQKKKSILSSVTLREIDEPLFLSPYLSLIREDSISKSNGAVIFDVHWETETKTSGWSLSSVNLSARRLCLVLKLPNPPFHDNLNDLYRFFASKFVTFVGVQIEEDLNLLRENHGLVIRNVMEVGQIAAKACRVLLKVEFRQVFFCSLKGEIWGWTLFYTAVSSLAFGSLSSQT